MSGDSTLFTDPGSSVINDSIIPNLCSGDYTFHFTDANNCLANLLLGGTWHESIFPLVEVKGEATTFNATCFNTPNGGASVADPNSLYTYTWENISNPGVPVDSGTTTNILSGGPVGGQYNLLTYYGDSASNYLNYLGCTDTFAFSIGQDPQILSGANATHLSCYGDSSGAITTNASGGVGGYDYLWNPTLETTQDISNLIAGTYTISITDANGCEIVDAVTINEPPPMLLDIVVDQEVSCFDGDDGKATVSVVNAPSISYTYSWNTNPVQTTSTAMGLSADIFTVIVTSPTGCSDTDTVIINEPLALELEIDIASNYSGSDIRCNGESNGAAIVSLFSGGTAPFSYVWVDSTTSFTLPYE